MSSSRNKKLQSALDIALEKIDNMSRDELFETFYGFSEKEFDEYTELSFMMELNSIVEIVKSCGGTHSPCHQSGDVKIKPSKLFYTYLRNNFQSLEDMSIHFSNELYTFPEQNLKIHFIHGQGTMEVYSLIGV